MDGEISTPRKSFSAAIIEWLGIDLHVTDEATVDHILPNLKSFPDEVIKEAKNELFKPA